ncbi:MAG: 4Fe-4S cluster-binding domain-containing protein [Candidatus Heimdallarchaeaceae archaeon]
MKKETFGETIMSNSLKINELFNSISGEFSIYGQGVSTTFLRLAGCNLKEDCCWYCDTPNREEINTEVTVEQFLPTILEECKKTGHLCITGGEPLLQIEAIKELLPHLPRVWIETNGTIDCKDLIGKVPLVVDYKYFYLCGSMPDWYLKLTEQDCVKFVIKDTSEFYDCLEVHKLINKYSSAKVAYSPLNGAHNNGLCDTIIKRLEKECLYGYINIQIHKHLNLK